MNEPLKSNPLKNHQLKQAKASIREFIRMHWSDEKLAAVYAFNRDGKMVYANGCCCLMGVTLSERLHESPQVCPWTHGLEPLHHYYVAQCLLYAHKAEAGYRNLGWVIWEYYHSEEIRRNRFSALLRAEMRRRERLRMPAPALAIEELASQYA